MTTTSASAVRPTITTQYRDVRHATEWLCEPLTIEDQVVQALPDASPVKWHLAHTTWFFETFVLKVVMPGYRPFDPAYYYLFDSYLNAVGEKFASPERGLLTRPTVEEIRRYRTHVDRNMIDLLESVTAVDLDLITLGLQHEQQHQELILTDLKYLLSRNPLTPVYRDGRSAPADFIPPLTWEPYAGGTYDIGHTGEGFAFDNESPRHQVLLRDFSLASRLVTSGDYKEFVDDGGYRRPELWLADGWKAVRERGWQAPLYWEERDGEWRQFTLSGVRPVEDTEPVVHVSYYEADAFARWADARLPTEAEWEIAAAPVPAPPRGNFMEDGYFHTLPLGAKRRSIGPAQLFGDVWEWTRSAYSAYPGFRPAEGALGEHNAKFMCNQYVLRGGSCATPRSHIRATYRNFFRPDARWQFTGIRLAKDGVSPVEV